MRFAVRLVAVVVLWGGGASVASAQVQIDDASKQYTYPTGPLGNVIKPDGTWRYAGSGVRTSIDHMEVEIGTRNAAGDFTRLTGRNPILATYVTGTWTAPAFTNLPAGRYVLKPVVYGWVGPSTGPPTDIGSNFSQPFNF